MPNTSLNSNSFGWEHKQVPIGQFRGWRPRWSIRSLIKWQRAWSFSNSSRSSQDV